MRLKHHQRKEFIMNNLGCERVDSNHRPLAYEANELPLLHSAMVAEARFELTTSWLWAKRATELLYSAISKGEYFSGRSPHDRTWKEMKPQLAVGTKGEIWTHDLCLMRAAL